LMVDDGVVDDGGGTWVMMVVGDGGR
jgi:hypothetical protein